MKKTIDISKNWLICADESAEGKAFSDTKTVLPFFHSAKDMAPCTFSTSWTALEEDDGKTVYIEFSQISGDIEIYSGDKLLGTHKSSSCSFRTLLTLEAVMNETYEIRVKVSPVARADSMFAFAGASLITVDSSHFNMTDLGKGIYTDYTLNNGNAELKVSTEVIRPNNYDVVSYTVMNMKGETLLTKTCKPTEPLCSFTIEGTEPWDGQSGAYLYKVNAKLLRDSRCLDEIETDFGLREISLSSDGFLYLNGFRLPLCGVCLTDCSFIKTDSSILKELDGNILISPLLPSKTNLLSVTDKHGMLFWYTLPYTGDIEADKSILREFLLMYRNHPSLAGVVLSEKADGNYFNELNAELTKYAPKTTAVVKRSIDNSVDTVPENAKIVLITIPYSTSPDAFISISGRFAELQSRYTDKFFAVIPETADKSTASPEEMQEWHVRLWNAFCRQKNLIAYLAGVLTDGKETDSPRGLISSDRTEYYDAFWFYRSQFSSKGFVKICNKTDNETDNKFTDIRCITNCKNLRILVNGKDKKYKAEKLTDGVYVFRQIKLKKDVNFIEVSADDEYDSTEIVRY